jgi:hypothetical protein
LYNRYRGAIEGRANASQGPNATPTAVFAKQVVQTVLKTSPPRYFTFGHFSTMFLIFFYLPRWITDRVLALVTMKVANAEETETGKKKK